MLNDGWEILAQIPHSGDSRGFRPFAKRDTSLVSTNQLDSELSNPLFFVPLPSCARHVTVDSDTRQRSDDLTGISIENNKPCRLARFDDRLHPGQWHVRRGRPAMATVLRACSCPNPQLRPRPSR